MLLTDRHGVVHITKTPYNQTQADIDRYNAKYGEGKWQYMENICSFLSEACGYGQPKNAYTCRYCDGKCIRPLLKAEKVSP